MFKKYSIVFLLFFYFTFSNQSFAQMKSDKFGIGASIGLTNKVQFHYSFSNQTQMSFDLGSILFDGGFQIDNLGTTFKYFFNETAFSSYVGISATVIVAGETIYYLNLPFGLQKFAAEDLAVFIGFNPGIIPLNNLAVVFAVELGVSFYL